MNDFVRVPQAWMGRLRDDLADLSPYLLLAPKFT